MEGRLGAKDLLEPARIHARDLGSVELAEAPLELEGARERLRHRYLLVEGEPDEECEWLFHEQPVGLVVAGEMQAVGRGRHSGQCSSEEAFATLPSAPFAKAARNRHDRRETRANVPATVSPGMRDPPPWVGGLQSRAGLVV